ncbi:hypothetical protein Gpo141_00014392, partial [Globisporangium polare]
MKKRSKWSRHGHATDMIENNYEAGLKTLRVWTQDPPQREHWIPRVSEFEPVGVIAKFVLGDGSNDMVEFWLLHLTSKANEGHAIESDHRVISEALGISGPKHRVR